jgi:CMP-N-acetylneuraminic acid synthetase
VTIDPQSVVAVIPARGGSKGLPRKNVLPLGGRPLIAHTIAAAREAVRVGRVVVSTDDAEIAAVARRCGAEVVDRPAELAGDTAGSEAALLHALDVLERQEGYRPSLLVFLQCTSPLTSAEDIDGTIATLIDEGADTAVSVTPFHYFLWRRDGDGAGVGINHDKAVRPLRQQREPQYVETGAIYVMKVEGFLRAKHRFFGATALHVTPAERRWEVDEPVDLIVAAALMAERDRRGVLDLLPNPPRALVMDFDGVFTDNRVLVDQDGIGERLVPSRGRDGPVTSGRSRVADGGHHGRNQSRRGRPVPQAGPALSARRPRQAAGAAGLARRAEGGPADAIYVGNDVNDQNLPAGGRLPRRRRRRPPGGADIGADRSVGAGRARGPARTMRLGGGQTGQRHEPMKAGIPSEDDDE